MDEPYIVIDHGRNVTVPNELKNIIVQYDHNVETFTFYCPRYSDGRDLSTMEIYVACTVPNASESTPCECTNVMIDPEDENYILFDWVIRENITQVSGTLEFLVCARQKDQSGNYTNRWHSKLNRDLQIAAGIKCHA